MYPKDFFDGCQLSPDLGTCFLIMPFAPKFGGVLRSIKKVLEDKLGFTCIRTDELLGGGNILEDILRGLASSELVVADLTGRNPNVFYELGIAHMCKQVEQVILLSQDLDDIPFDLRPFRHILYRPSATGLKAMTTALREAVSAVGQKVHRIILDRHGHGELPERLMGKDRCLYAFKVNYAFVGHNSAKVSLAVTRYVMGAKLQSACVFNAGMGLSLGQPTPIGRTEWGIVLEKARGGKPCFRIIQSNTAKSLSKPGRMPVSTKANAQSAGRRIRSRIQ